MAAKQLVELSKKHIEDQQCRIVRQRGLMAKYERDDDMARLSGARIVLERMQKQLAQMTAAHAAAEEHLSKLTVDEPSVKRECEILRCSRAAARSLIRYCRYWKRHKADMLATPSWMLDCRSPVGHRRYSGHTAATSLDAPASHRNGARQRRAVTGSSARLAKPRQSSEFECTGFFETTVGVVSSPALMALCIVARNALSIFSWSLRTTSSSISGTAPRRAGRPTWP